MNKEKNWRIHTSFKHYYELRNYEYVDHFQKKNRYFVLFYPVNNIIIKKTSEI